VTERSGTGTQLPIRCLHVINSLGRGGAEQALVNLLPELQARGTINEVATLTGPMTLEPYLRATGIRVHNFGLAGPWDPRGPLVLASLLRGSDYDVVQSHLSASMLVAGLSRSLAPRARRVALHLNLFYDTPGAKRLRHRASKPLVGLVARTLIDSHVAVSTETAKHYEKHLGIRGVTVIPLSAPLIPGSRTASGAPPTNGQISVITPARFIAEKGHRYLVEAIALLRARKTPIRALLVGDGPLAGEVRNHIHIRGLDDVVEIRASVPHDQAIQLINDADVLVLPSTQEGLPVAALEAMSLGKPVVASAVGGLKDLVVDGETGLLVRPADPESLADALGRLAESLDDRIRFGVAAKERFVSRYSSGTIADEWLTLYRRLSSA
jgi:glycosyltransferase involved in cell wall biosynthesis